MKPILSADALHKSYRSGTTQLHVLRGVDLAVSSGEVVALRGASGSGKSTLLHLLGLLDQPDQGAVYLNGSPTAGLSRTALAHLRARSLGFVFQAFHLLPELTVLENVLIPRRLALGLGWLRSRKQERAAALDLLDRVGLADRARHRPAQLSGGEQQRAALARALVSRPSVLLADEPTGNLDRGSGERILSLLLDLGRSEGAAVLIATHNRALAESCDRAVELTEGMIRDGVATA